MIPGAGVAFTGIDLTDGVRKRAIRILLSCLDKSMSTGVPRPDQIEDGLLRASIDLHSLLESSAGSIRIDQHDGFLAVG